MPRLTFFTQAAEDIGVKSVSAENLINLYPEPAPGDGVTRFILRIVRGQEAHASLGASNIRDSVAIGKKIYVAAGGALYSVAGNGTVTNLGAITDSEDTVLDKNGSNVTIAAGGTYYVWDGSSLTTPGSGRLSSVGSVALNDFDTILTELNGDEVEWTTTADPTTRSALNFKQKEGRDDKVLRALPFGRQLYIFGERSTEVWYNTGVVGGSRYQRLAGGLIDQGIKSAALATRFDAGIFVIGDDDMAYIVNRGFEPVSTPTVNSDIKASTPTKVFYYEHRGHKFLCIRFSDRPAWCYDITTRIWHRRATGAGDAWEAADVLFSDDWYLITASGDVRQMADNQADVGQALTRTMVSKPLYMDGAQFSVPMLTIGGETGVSDTATINIRSSFDNGRTYGATRSETLGPEGAYSAEARFNMLGRASKPPYTFTVEATMTDASDVPLFSDALVRIS